MIKSRKATYFIILYAALIIVAAVIAWNQRGAHEAKAPEVPARQTPNQVERTSLKEYKDSQASYSFFYPGNVFNVYDKQLRLPFLNAQKLVDAMALVHTVPVEHCGLSGLPEHCTPTTTDISISFAVINYSIDTIRNSKIGSDLSPAPVPDLDAWFMESGAEGEGVLDYFIPLGKTKSLWMRQSYINERIEAKYQNEAAFIPFSRQADITSGILQSIKINK